MNKQTNRAEFPSCTWLSESALKVVVRGEGWSSVKMQGASCGPQTLHSILSLPPSAYSSRFTLLHGTSFLPVDPRAFTFSVAYAWNTAVSHAHHLVAPPFLEACPSSAPTRQGLARSGHPGPSAEERRWVLGVRDTECSGPLGMAGCMGPASRARCPAGSIRGGTGAFSIVVTLGMLSATLVPCRVP